MIVRATLLLALAVAAAYFMKSAGAWSTEPEQAKAVGVAPAVEVATSARPDCRYWIVPGGVYSIADVRAAAERDAVVAQHYTVINIGSLREEHAAEGRHVFVSYRVGDEVYWSSERVALDHGEVILTDGRHEIRARCGSLVSNGTHLEAGLRRPAYMPGLTTAEFDENETGSSSTAATSGDPIVPAGSGVIGLPPGQDLTNPGPGGSTPSPTTPGAFVIPGGHPGGSNSGSPGGTGGGTGGGGGTIGGGGDTDGDGLGGGSGSGDVGGSADDRSSGGGSGSGGAEDGNSSGGTGSGDGGNSGGGVGPGGSGSSNGGGSSSPNSNPGGPDTGNPGGSGNGGSGTEKPDWVLVAQSDGNGGERAPVSVPEPTSLSLFAIGLGAAALAGRRNKKR